MLGAYGLDLELGILRRVGRVDPEVRGLIYILEELRLAGDLGIVGKHHGVGTCIGLYSVYSADVLHLALEGHRTAVAMHAGKVLDAEGLEFHTLFDAPLFVDGRHFETAAEDDSESGDGNCHQCRNEASELIVHRFGDHAELERLARARRDTLAAEGAVHVRHHSAAAGDVDIVRTMLLAVVAAHSAVFVVVNDVQQLQLGLAVEDFEQIPHHAEGGEQHPPLKRQAEGAEPPPYQREDQQRQPEPETVSRSSERAEVAAEETLDEEASHYYDYNGDYAHPEHQLALEAGGDCVVWVELAAQQLAGGGGGVEDPEKQAVFERPHKLVGYTAGLELQTVEPYGFTEFGEQVFDRSDGAEIGAEQLAEQNDCRGQQYAHQDLPGTH